MLESINVRFFAFEQDEFGELDTVEIDYNEFTDLRSIAEPMGARTDIVKYSVFANGCRQLCVTLWAERETGEPV